MRRAAGGRGRRLRVRARTVGKIGAWTLVVLVALSMVGYFVLLSGR